GWGRRAPRAGRTCARGWCARGASRGAPRDGRARPIAMRPRNRPIHRRRCVIPTYLTIAAATRAAATRAPFRPPSHAGDRDLGRVDVGEDLPLAVHLLPRGDVVAMVGLLLPLRVRVRRLIGAALDSEVAAAGHG